MSVDEARFILSACTRADLEHPDADVREALRVAEADAVLGSEWARQQAMDRAVAARIAEIQPPPDLRARILAGERASLPVMSRRRIVLAWAAGLAVAFTGGGLTWQRNRNAPRSLDRFRTDMVRFLNEEWDHTFDLTAPVAADLLKALAAGPIHLGWGSIEREEDLKLWLIIDRPVAQHPLRACHTSRARAKHSQACFHPSD